MRKVIVNSTPLIALCKIQALDILRQLYGEVTIPESVLNHKGSDIMAEEAVLQVAMDAELMDRAERLYQRLGTSFAEAVRIFARRSVEEGAMPFDLPKPVQRGKRPLGLANGKFTIPDDLDEHNGEIAAMFGLKS